MKTFKPIKVPIFFKSEDDLEAEQLAELGIEREEAPLSENPVKDVLFYSIDVVSPYGDNGVIYSRIFSGGDYFVSSVLFADFEQFINQQLPQ